MIQQQSFGLQWKLAAIYLAVSLLSSGMAAAGYFLGTELGLQPVSALGVGFALSLATGLAGSAVGFAVARSIKLRVWEAGDMAGRIARGDFGARLPEGRPDEIGWLEEQLNAMAHHLETAVGELSRLAEQNRELAEDARRGAAVEERARLARDLHDTVNQQLFVLTMRCAAARRRLEKLGGEAEALVPELSALEELAREAHGEARKLILQLRPTTLEQQGLGPALAEYVKSAAAKDNLAVELEIDPAVRLMGPAAESLFRVAQEALNNISKHAEASTVWVKLGCNEDGLLLVIKDDGKGFDLRGGVRPTAVGLVGMQERVSAMGGTLRVKSAREAGTEVAVSLPPGAEGGNAT